MKKYAFILISQILLYAKKKKNVLFLIDWITSRSATATGQAEGAANAKTGGTRSRRGTALQ